MLRSTKGGFSLLEVIIAVGLLAGISTVAVQSLWDSVTSRAKEYSIETTSAAMRQVITTITQAVIASTQLSVDASSTVLKITGSPCRTIQLNVTSHTIDQATAAGASCAPPTSGFSALTPNNISIATFTVTPVGSGITTVTIAITGTYADSIGSHTVQYNTTVSARNTL